MSLYEVSGVKECWVFIHVIVASQKSVKQLIEAINVHS